MTDQKNNSTHIASQTTEVSRNAYRNMGESQEVLLLKPHLTMTGSSQALHLQRFHH